MPAAFSQQRVWLDGRGFPLPAAGGGEGGRGPGLHVDVAQATLKSSSGRFPMRCRCSRRSGLNASIGCGSRWPTRYAYSNTTRIG